MTVLAVMRSALAEKRPMRCVVSSRSKRGYGYLDGIVSDLHRLESCLPNRGHTSHYVGSTARSRTSMQMR